MREMTRQEALEFLAHNRSGVLSLADEGRAYGVPLYYAFDGRAIYVHTRAGLKGAYARATREACFTVIRVIGLDDWASVQVFGPLEPLGVGPERMAAYQALMRVPLPPEFGESLHGEPARSDQNVVTYRLVPQRISGRYSEPPPIAEEEKEIALGGM